MQTGLHVPGRDTPQKGWPALRDEPSPRKDAKESKTEAPLQIKGDQEA